MSVVSLKVPIQESDHRLGPMKAPVQLIEYGDFQCPYCAMAFVALEPVLQEFKGGELCFVYRHFPLRNVHPFAELAALASEAANQQDRFWQMHDLLFENHEALTPSMISRLAESLHLDMGRFRTDVARPELRNRVQLDFNGGVRSGVNGTPTLYFNGERFDGPLSLTAYRDAILQRLNRRFDGATGQPRL